MRHKKTVYTTCDDVMNQSDHLPLLNSIDIEVPTGTLDNSTVINPFSTVKAPRQLWDRADITDRVLVVCLNSFTKKIYRINLTT